MKKATQKNPPMTEVDYLRASSERWEEARYLYEGQILKPENNYWISIIFLSVVAVECLYTAFMLKANINANLVTDHNFLKYRDRVPFTQSNTVKNPHSVIERYWRHWPDDLRYLDTCYFIRRVTEKKIIDANKYDMNDSPKIIGEDIYHAARIIIKGGKYRWI